MGRQLERAASTAIRWGKDNAVAFEIHKTEAMFLSRIRRHWKDRTGSVVRVGGAFVPFNQVAARCWIDSRLSFREHARRYEDRARRAERELSCFVRRNRVPPLSARHLQEAIVGTTIMYGSEVTWKARPSWSRVYRESSTERQEQA